MDRIRPAAAAARRRDIPFTFSLWACDLRGGHTLNIYYDYYNNNPWHTDAIQYSTILTGLRNK